MNEEQWNEYMQLIQVSESSIPSACVGCWYEQHDRQAFPGDTVSSTLCTTHVSNTPPAVKDPDAL